MLEVGIREFGETILVYSESYFDYQGRIAIRNDQEFGANG